MRQQHLWLPLALVLACGALLLVLLLVLDPSHLAAPPPVQHHADVGMPRIDAGPPAADLSFNPQWIGSACASDIDCPYEGGLCLQEQQGFPRGTCSRACDRLCPDRQGDLFSTTLCVEDFAGSQTGLCLPRCNLHLTPSGCRPGYICSSVRRRREGSARLVCLPDLGTAAPATLCTQRLVSLGLHFARPDLADSLALPAKPGDPVPDNNLCQIDTPVLLASPIEGIDYRERGQRHAESLLVACEFAVALQHLSRILVDLDVVEVEHVGTFNCRGIAGTRSLSGHGHALAIDIVGFERTTELPVSVLHDWSGSDPERRQFLRTLVKRMKDEAVFDKILTPAANSAHADHLHLELRALTPDL